MGVSLATHHDRQDALTMLTEPDMQARYVAATLGVIETELRKLDMPANNKRALVALVAGATKAAARLANELDRPGSESFQCSPAVAAQSSNVVAFRR